MNAAEKSIITAVANGVDNTVRAASHAAGVAEVATAKMDEAINATAQEIGTKVKPDAMQLSQRAKNALHNLVDNNPNLVFVSGTTASSAATGSAVGTIVMPGVGTSVGGLAGGAIGGGGGVTLAAIKDSSVAMDAREAMTTSHVLRNEALIGSGITSAASGVAYFTGDHASAMSIAQGGGAITAGLTGVTGIFRYIRDFFNK